MANATGEAKEPPLRITFDRRFELEFHGARITLDAGLLAHRELDDTLGPITMVVSTLASGRRERNIRPRPLGLLRQVVHGQLTGDPAMRAIIGIGREGMDRLAASTSSMGRFETEWLAGY